MAIKPFDILLIQNDHESVEVIKKALEDSRLEPNLHVVNDGTGATAFLNRHGHYAEAPCPDLGANCYVTKPMDQKQFLKLVESIMEFWLTIAKLPTRTRQVY